MRWPADPRAPELPVPCHAGRDGVRRVRCDLPTRCACREPFQHGPPPPHETFARLSSRTCPDACLSSPTCPADFDGLSDDAFAGFFEDFGETFCADFCEDFCAGLTSSGAAGAAAAPSTKMAQASRPASAGPRVRRRLAAAGDGIRRSGTSMDIKSAAGPRGASSFDNAESRLAQAVKKAPPRVTPRDVLRTGGVRERAGRAWIPLSRRAGRDKVPYQREEQKWRGGCRRSWHC